MDALYWWVLAHRFETLLVIYLLIGLAYYIWFIRAAAEESKLYPPPQHKPPLPVIAVVGVIVGLYMMCMWPLMCLVINRPQTPDEDDSQ